MSPSPRQGGFFMHLIIGSSDDATADMIVDGLGSDAVIRVNNDRPHDLSITIRHDGFTVSDQFGRKINESNLRTVILRKPKPVEQGEAGEELYARREFTKAMEGLLDWIERFKPEALPISHRAMNKATKFVCATVAKAYFEVPEWAFTTSPATGQLKRPVLKNLCGMPLEEAGPGSDGKLVYVQEVKLEELAENWPWFVQEKVEARYDLTVLYLGGECHALRLDRSKFEGLDWRKFIGSSVDEKWEVVDLPKAVTVRIGKYMADMNLNYGRLDFLYSQEDLGDLQFLEVNPHGQWAWMDLDKKRGIFTAMMRFLSTPVLVG